MCHAAATHAQTLRKRETPRRRTKKPGPRGAGAKLRGAPRGIRTHDLLLRRQTLSSTELWARCEGQYSSIAPPPQTGAPDAVTSRSHARGIIAQHFTHPTQEKRMIAVVRDSATDRAARPLREGGSRTAASRRTSPRETTRRWSASSATPPASTRSCSRAWTSSSASSAFPEPFKLANRKFHPEDTVVDCGPRGARGRRQLPGDRRAVLGRGRQPHRDSPRRARGRRHHAARRRLQAPDLPLHLPGHGASAGSTCSWRRAPSSTCPS